MSDERRPDAEKAPSRGRKPVDSNWQSVGPLATIGLEIGLTVAVLSVLGWWLDGQWNTTPWLTLTGAAIGIVGVTYKMLRLSASMDPPKREDSSVSKPKDSFDSDRKP